MKLLPIKQTVEENHSAKILRKNGFELMGLIWDEEDGDVWEWVYKK